MPVPFEDIEMTRGEYELFEELLDGKPGPVRRSPGLPFITFVVWDNAGE